METSNERRKMMSSYYYCSMPSPSSSPYAVALEGFVAVLVERSLMLIEGLRLVLDGLLFVLDVFEAVLSNLIDIPDLPDLRRRGAQDSN